MPPGPQWVNTLRPRQNGRLFTDNIFTCIFLNENVWISVKISLKFVVKGSINNIPASVQIMAWRRLGDKPLSEPMMVRLATFICVARPQWVNNLLACNNDNILTTDTCMLWRGSFFVFSLHYGFVFQGWYMDVYFVIAINQFIVCDNYLAS